MVKRLSHFEASAVMQEAGLDPLEPYRNSQSPWRCRCRNCGAEVFPRYSNVKSQGSGCQSCAGNGHLSPGRISEVLGRLKLRPLAPYMNANEPWAMLCLVCNREVQPRMKHLLSGASQGCKFCAGRISDEEAENYLKAGGFIPLEQFPGQKKPWRAECVECNRVSSPTLYWIRRGSRCGFCAGNRIDPTEAVLEMRSRGLEPLDVYPGSHSPWKSKCLDCGEQVAPRLNNLRSSDQGGCLNCAGLKRLSEGEAEEILRRWGFDPLVPYPGSQLGWFARCKLCHSTVQPLLSRRNRLRDKYDCPACTQASRGRARLLVLEALDLDPLEAYPGAAKRWRMRCRRCGDDANPTWSQASSQGVRGCPTCRLESRAWRRVPEDEAVAELRAAGFEPLVGYPGANQGWRSQCMECSAEVFPALTRLRAGHGCSSCSVGGIRRDEPAIVYLLEHPLFRAAKIGIAKGDGSGRLRQHSRNGWTTFRVWPVREGRIAFAAESRVLNLLRSFAIGPAVSPEEMPQHGYTETVSVDDVSPQDLVELISLALEEA